MEYGALVALFRRRLRELGADPRLARLLRRDPGLVAEKCAAALTDVLNSQSQMPDGRKKHFLLPDHARMDSVLELRKALRPRQPKTPISLFRSALGWFQTPAPTTRLPGQRICIVGVHGWFPTKVLQTVVGVPKGTSARLCRMMSQVTREFLDRQPLAYFEAPPRIDCVPLEGAGCIDERTGRHFAQLTDIVGEGPETGQELIQRSDSVIFVSHSQGAPVTALLATRMIDAGILNPKRQNVGVLTLAGVFHGPFTFLKENLVVRYVEADAARELFDLNDPQGALSQRIHEALSRLLRLDVTFACVASWMDQVVPLYSSTLLGVEHPNIWRAVYIDAHNYRPDFLSQLVKTALTLVNAQVAGARELLAQLGGVLAGSLYQSNAHSTLYDDHGVYETILLWMTTIGQDHTEKAPSLHLDQMMPRLSENPYALPWTMRGILADPRLASNPLFKSDLDTLRELHQQWRPDRKAWRDLRMQLEPISKL